MKKILVASALVTGLASAAPAGRIAGSKHDLSTSGPGQYRAATETNPCAFCHVPHDSGANLTSRPDLPSKVRPYESSTLSTPAVMPNRASRVCLSCHDGTIAVGRTRNRDIELVGGNRPIAPGSRSNLGTDLRRSHPISVRPAGNQRTQSPHRGGAVRLGDGGVVECTSCHDPHAEWGDPELGKFLVMPASGSHLCRSCHTALGTAVPSRHETSTATFRREGGRSTTVAAAGCLACHDTHGAAPAAQLTREGVTSDATCLSCHDGTVASGNVAADLRKPSSHASTDRTTHDAGEGPEAGDSRRLPEASPAAKRHVTCTDCHEPHGSGGPRAAAPTAPGAIAGTWGIDLEGRKVAPVRFEYEVCFKCHADSANKPRGSALSISGRRPSSEENLRKVFAADAVSSHPVTGPGRNPLVPSLKSPLTPASMIFCTDCHASDQASGNGPRGPHGSIYSPLLERPYQTLDFTTESPAAYALCYKCHDRELLLSDASPFRLTAPPRSGGSTSLHRRHVVEQSAPCSACHDAHGISRESGTDTGNARLIRFDPSIAAATKDGPASYSAAGPGVGSCNLTCHNRVHEARTGSYPMLP